MPDNTRSSIWNEPICGDDFARLEDLFSEASAPGRAEFKIRGLRRIQPWENYFLCSAICSVGKALGAAVDDYRFLANFTGDNFACLYAADAGNPGALQCDSGLSNYFLLPALIKRGFAALGYDCLYISQGNIAANPEATMRAIRASVDRGIPVLSCGMGNVMMRGGDCSILPEACLIGGYGEGGTLYVNLYPGKERLPDGSLDEFGYSTIRDGLSASQGLFFACAKLDAPDMRGLYAEALAAIPDFLSGTRENSDRERYAFGSDAFDVWALTLEDDSHFDRLTDEALQDVCWNLHCSPYCCVCTSAAAEFMRNAAELYPDMTAAARMLPLCERVLTLRQSIWEMQEGFFPPMDKFRRHEFRAGIAAILREMGGVLREMQSELERA